MPIKTGEFGADLEGLKPEVLAAVEALDAVGMFITSGTDDAPGRKEQSGHKFGLDIDIRRVDRTESEPGAEPTYPDILAAWNQENEIKAILGPDFFTKMEGSHIHVAWRPERNRPHPQEGPGNRLPEPDEISTLEDQDALAVQLTFDESKLTTPNATGNRTGGFDESQLSPLNFTGKVFDESKLTPITPSPGFTQILTELTGGEGMHRPSFTEMLAQATDGFQASLAGGAEAFTRGIPIPVVEDMNAWFAEMKARNEGEAALYGIPEITRLSDIEGISDVGDFVLFALAQGLSSMGFSIGAGAAGAVVGGLVSGGNPLGVVAGGAVGAFSVSALAGAGELAGEIENQGGSINDQKLLLAAGASIFGALDLAGAITQLRPLIGPLLKSFGKEVIVKELVRAGFKKAVVRPAIESLLVEGATEGAQEFTTVALAGIATGTELDPSALIDRIATAAAIGAITGGTVGGLSAGGVRTMTDLRQAGLEASLIQTNFRVQQLIESVYKGEATIEDVSTELNALEHIRARTQALTSAPAAVDDKPIGVLANFVGGLVGRTAGRFERFRIMSPQLKKLHELVYGDATDPTQGQGGTIFQSFHLLNGDYMNPITEAFHPFEGDKAKMEQLSELLSTPDEEIDVLTSDASPEVMEARNTIRDVLNKIKKDADKLGLKAGYVRGFLPRRLMADAILKNIAGFKAILNKYLVDKDNQPTMTEEGMDALINRLVSNEGFILDTISNAEVKLSQKEMDTLANGTKEEQDALLAELDEKTKVKEGKALDKLLGKNPRKARSASLEHRRQLALIPDEALSEFRETNVARLLQLYTRQAARRITYVREFGVREEKLARMLIEGSRAATEAGRDPPTDTELNALRTILDTYNQLHKPFLDNRIRKLDEQVTLYQFLRTLPMAVLSSLTEPMLLILQAGPQSALYGVKVGMTDLMARMSNAAIRAGGGKDKFKRNTYYLDAIADINFANEYAGVQLASSRFAGQAPVSERIVEITEKFFRYNGLEGWTFHTRMMAIAAFDHMYARNARYIREGKATQSLLDRFTSETLSLGIDPIQMLEFQNELARAGGKLTDELRASEFYQKQVRPGKLRFVNQIIMFPDPALKPIWANNPHLRQIGLIKAFQLAFANTVIRSIHRGLRKSKTPGLTTKMQQENFLRMVVAVLPMIAVAGMVNGMRDLLKGRDPRDLSVSQHFTRAVDRTGLLGIVSFIRESFTAHTFGGRPSAPLEGPLLGQALDLLGAIGVAVNTAFNGGPDFKPLAREALDAIPFVSAALPIQLKDLVRDGMKDALENVGLAGQ